jgi:hypothetical protein
MVNMRQEIRKLVDHPVNFKPTKDEKEEFKYSKLSDNKED